jgi:WD repeat-containing protein 45
MSLQNTSGEIYVSFNQTEKYACFGTSIGFYIYSLNPFKKILSRKIDSGISLVKMLYESNIIIFVGKSDKGMYPNNKLIIWDDSKKTVLGEITYNSPIQNINVTKDYIVVLVKKKIYIYNFESLYLKRTIDINPHNNKLMCMGLENSEFLVYPGEEKGSIHITKLSEDYSETIQAHQSNIENLYISNDGKYIVTASEKGTVIRIFSTTTKEKVNEFRRGCDPTKIIDLRLNHSNAILLVSSIKGTVHLYNTGIDSNLVIQNPSFDSYGMYYVKWALPQYFSDRWSFMQFNLPDISTFSTFDRHTSKIYSFGHDGQYYELNYSDIENPTIEKTIRYISDESDPFADRSSTIK